MAILIQCYRLTRYQFPRQRVIGDSQVYVDTHHLLVLELESDSGHIGLGFQVGLLFPLPPLEELDRVFRLEVAPWVVGQSPVALANRLGRPRGGNIRSHIFGQAVNQAVWDLQAKALSLPLYRLLGGTNPRVRAYASGLDFHMTDAEFRAFFQKTAEQGFSAFKIKVGHPDLAWDLARLRALVDVVGPHATIMVDANEAWTPKEAIRRAHAYRDAGFNIFWIEDPCLRDDFAGLARVAQEVSFTHINAGEYLDVHGKRQLIEARAVDILNIHGHISDSMRIAWLAADHGLTVSVGNTMFELGAHIAAALPEHAWLEYSFQDYNHLIDYPIDFEQGYAILSDRPGFGFALNEAARRDLGGATTMLEM